MSKRQSGTSTWMVKDNEAGRTVRFTYPGTWEQALKAYIKYLSPHLTVEDIDNAMQDFNGEIWYASDPHDIIIPYDLRTQKQLEDLEGMR